MAGRSPHPRPLVVLGLVVAVTLLPTPGGAAGPARPAVPQGQETAIPVLLGGLSGKSGLHLRQARLRSGTGPLEGPETWHVAAEGGVVVVSAARQPVRRLNGLQAAPVSGPMTVAADPAASGRRLTVPVTLTARDGRLNVVALIPESRYIAGVVDGEMTPSAPHQALRAQAIVARTFLQQSRRRHQSAGAWVCDQSHCQIWHHDADPHIAAAVADTAGLVVTGPDGRLAPVYYHANCGGSTVAVHLVYGGPPVAHLGGISDVACQAEPVWQARVPLEEAASALRQAGLIGTGVVRSLAVADQTVSGWPVSLRVEGEVSRTVSAYQAWLAFGRKWGWGKLPGLHFALRQDGPALTIRGQGIGHGIGLCQRGTMRMASGGQSAERILSTYFPGTRVGRP